MEKYSLIMMLATKLASSIIYATVILIVADTVFGCGRAIKERILNSSFGIDGAIRKVSMLLSLVFCACIDLIISIDLLPLFPEQLNNVITKYLYIPHLGLAEFFSLLFIMYEMVSVLKNMYLCGLPVKGVYGFIRKLLTKYTNELPDNDDIYNKKEVQNNE